VTECCDALNLPDIKAGLKVGDERICSPTACDNATICDFRTALQAFALEGVRIQDLATLEIEILDVPNHQLSLKPQDTIPQTRQHTVAASIRRAALLVAAAVNFHDQLGTRRYEVGNEPPHHHLPAKRHAQLPLANGFPQLLLWPRRVGPHELRALGQK
jgi:hypothetical protein